MTPEAKQAWRNVDIDLRENGWRRKTKRVIDREAGTIRCESVDEEGKRWSTLAFLPEGPRRIECPNCCGEGGFDDMGEDVCDLCEGAGELDEGWNE